MAGFLEKFTFNILRIQIFPFYTIKKHLVYIHFHEINVYLPNITLVKIQLLRIVIIFQILGLFYRFQQKKFGPPTRLKTIYLGNLFSGIGDVTKVNIYFMTVYAI